MNYKIVVATVLGLLITKASSKPTNHFDIEACSQISVAKTLYLKDVGELIKEKISMCDKDGQETLAELHNKFKELLGKAQDSRKKIHFLAKDLEKTKKSDLKKEESKEDEDGVSEEDKTKNDELVFEWIDDYHNAAMTYSELNYRFFLVYGKSTSMKFIENFIENHTVHTDGFFTNAVKFAILIPVLMGLMQFV